MHSEVFESGYFIEKEKSIAYIIKVEFIDDPLLTISLLWLQLTLLSIDIIVVRSTTISESVLENDHSYYCISDPYNHQYFDYINQSIDSDHQVLQNLFSLVLLQKKTKQSDVSESVIHFLIAILYQKRTIVQLEYNLDEKTSKVE